MDNMQDTFQIKIQKALEISDPDQFVLSEHIICGDECVLCVPTHIGVKWTNDNKYLRSVVYRKRDFFPISLSFMKFTNWGENPENFPVPTSLKNTVITEKIDGSLLIVSKYKGNFILRTRGTVDATKLDNGHELELFKTNLKEKHLLNGNHPFESVYDTDHGSTWPYSFLFEWTSPEQRIILNYGNEPDWHLVGIVDHSDYSLGIQSEVDSVAEQFGFLRPPVYTFPTVEDLINEVELWKGKEGVCVYSNNGQTIHKVKAFEYLYKHRFKSEATLENTLDLYFSMGKPPYQEFEKKLIEAFDYECFEMVRGFISIICDAQKEVQKILDGFDVFIERTLKPLATRKDQAQQVLASYSNTNRASFIFAKLDGKSLSNDQIKKLFWQILKK